MSWELMFCECKVNGYLDKAEKEKCDWIKQNLKIPVFVAKKNNGVEYIEQ